jgi:hypothetical protein
MADIKAKDIAVAESIASSDLILGSSINGTTANVTVETLENHAINTKTYSSLNNLSVQEYCNFLFNQTKMPRTLHSSAIDFAVTQQNVWENTNISVTVPQNHLYLIYAWTGFSNAATTGMLLSDDPVALDYVSISVLESGTRCVRQTPAVIVRGKTITLWVKRTSTKSERTSLNWIDLGELINA